MELFSIFNIIAFVVGVLSVTFIFTLLNHFQKKSAQKLATELIQEATDQAHESKDELDREIKSFEEESQLQFDKDTESRFEKLEFEKLRVKEKELDLKQKIEIQKKSFNKRKNSVDQIKNTFQKKKSRYLDIKNQIQKASSDFSEQLIDKVSDSKESLIKQLKEQIITTFQVDTTKKFQLWDEEFQMEVEKKAKRILYIVLNRLQRSYSPDRGINNINFSSEKVMKRVLGPNNEHVDLLEQWIGVDLTPHPDRLFLNVSGFDPVRRELTRLTVENLMKDSRLDTKRVETVFKKSKKELLKRIRINGNKISSELGLRDLHSNIRNMLGSLKYRYSYTQNQYYHVSEVGWVCGLLASELGGIEIKTARRSGLLHDVGKAMDHSIDGGHAVIGADFIEQNGESPEVIHAVRAHHYDETPDSDLAYLVIAADAVSGARPGARRSTTESYTQKLSDLERIGNSFKGVKSTFILSAGREVRLFVDNRNMDDQKALELSQNVAHKIEEECAFPGQIRVTVVRRTEAVQYAK